MTHTYWQKQTKDTPLFDDLLWSRPENKAFAGKLLIAGGDAHGFAAPGEAFAAAQAAGIGVARVALPDSVKKLVPAVMQPQLEFLPGVKNGSFAKSALGELLDAAAWADVVLLAGGVGRNSETSALLERFIQEFSSRLVVTEDALDLLHQTKLLERQGTVVVAALGQLQKLWPHSEAPVIAHSDGLPVFVDKLHQLTSALPSTVITVHNQQTVVAHNGLVSTTPNDDDVWRIKTAATAATWLAQHPDQPFESITTSLVHH